MNWNNKEKVLFNKHKFSSIKRCRSKHGLDIFSTTGINEESTKPKVCLTAFQSKSQDLQKFFIFDSLFESNSSAAKSPANKPKFVKLDDGSKRGCRMRTFNLKLTNSPSPPPSKLNLSSLSSGSGHTDEITAYNTRQNIELTKPSLLNTPIANTRSPYLNPEILEIRRMLSSRGNENKPSAATNRYKSKTSQTITILKRDIGTQTQ